MTKNQTERSRTAWHRTIAAICVAVGIIVVALVVINIAPGKNVTSYQECKDARGAIAESDPRQCTVNGKTYVQGSTDGGSKTDTGEPHAYVGLSEEDALNKAKSENKPARVVSRNGEELPVTMDFVKGRLNLTVNNGKVEKVEVEGE